MLVEPRMARRERQRVTGLPVHIIQRGNNRQACFYAEADHLFFLHHLRELAKRAQCEVHAYVLMTNHVHLLVTPTESMGSDPLKRTTSMGSDPLKLRGLRVSAHSGYAIGSCRFRQEIESALKLRAAPRGPGRPTIGARL